MLKQEVNKLKKVTHARANKCLPFILIKLKSKHIFIGAAICIFGIYYIFGMGAAINISILLARVRILRIDLDTENNTLKRTYINKKKVQQLSDFLKYGLMCGQGLNRMYELITKLSVLVFLTVSLANPIYELWVVLWR